MNTFDHPYYIHKCLDSQLSTFLLVNRCIIFNKFDRDIQLHMIMIYTGALPGQGPRGNSNSAHILAPAFLQIQLDLNDDASPGHSSLGSDRRYTCSSLSLMVWWLPYLAKSPMPDFNNCPGNSLNSSRSLDLRRLLETDLNNGPSPSHSNSVSDGICVCSGLLVMVSCPVPYPSKGRRPDFNNGSNG